MMHCDLCGSDKELLPGYVICEKCKRRLKPRWDRELQEAIASYLSNHPNNPLPGCFLPYKLEVNLKNGKTEIVTLSDNEKYYSNENNFFFMGSDLRLVPSNIAVGTMYHSIEEISWLPLKVQVLEWSK